MMCPPSSAQSHAGAARLLAQEKLFPVPPLCSCAGATEVKSGIEYFCPKGCPAGTKDNNANTDKAGYTCSDIDDCAATAATAWRGPCHGGFSAKSLPLVKCTDVGSKYTCSCGKGLLPVFGGKVCQSSRTATSIVKVSAQDIKGMTQFKDQVSTPRADFGKVR